MVIAEYIRLSQADRDVMKKENKTESESIAHQRDLIRGYIQSHTDLKDCEIREFYIEAEKKLRLELYGSKTGQEPAPLLLPAVPERRAA